MTRSELPDRQTFSLLPIDTPCGLPPVHVPAARRAHDPEEGRGGMNNAETGAPLWPAGHIPHGWGDQPAAGFSPIVPAEPRSPGRDILLIGLMLAAGALGLFMGWPK